MIQAAPNLFDRLTALADPTRSRMLFLLEKHELTVSELSAVLQLPQSTTSRHLKTLGDEGWVVSRSEGTRRLYTMAPARLDAPGRRIWGAVREQLAESPLVAQDQGRLGSVLAARRSKAEEFFSTASGQWDRVRAELFGDRADLVALLALLDERWAVGDLGCGTGQLSATLAPFVRQVVAVDASSEMLDAARRRLEGRANVATRPSRSCCTTCPTRRARSARPRAWCVPAGRCWWSTCCRTRARSIARRWGTCGRDSRRPR